MFLDISNRTKCPNSLNVEAGADPRCLGSAMSRRDRSGQVARLDRTAPSAHRRRSKTTSAPAHDFFAESFVFIDILALFPPKTCPEPRQSGLAQTPALWGLRCPEGTGEGKRHNLTEHASSAHRRRSKATSGPAMPFCQALCFHRHSRFVPFEKLLVVPSTYWLELQKNKRRYLRCRTPKPRSPNGVAYPVVFVKRQEVRFDWKN